MLPAEAIELPTALADRDGFFAYVKLPTGETLKVEQQDGVLAFPEHARVDVSIGPKSDSMCAAQCEALAHLPFPSIGVTTEHLSAAGLAPLRLLRRAESISVYLSRRLPVPHAEVAELSQLQSFKASEPIAAGACDVKNRGLRVLELWQLPSLGDDDLNRIAAAAPALVELKLSRRYVSGNPEPGISDEGLAALAGLARLELLDLFDCDGVSDGGVKHLVGLPLRTLSLGGARLTDAGLTNLRGLGSLEELSLSGDFSDNGVEELVELPLKALWLSCQRLDLVALPPHLEKLHLMLREASNATLASVGRVTSLQSLSLGLTEEMSDRGIAALGSLTNLKKLDLGSAREKLPSLSDTWADPLKSLSELVDLTVGTGCNDEALRAFAHARQLERLSVKGSFTSNGLSDLARLTQLESLTLRGGAVGAGFLTMTKLPRLSEVYLTDCKSVGNGTLKQLAQLPSLTQLEITDGKFSEAGVKILAAATGLKRLRLLRCHGVTKAVTEHLRSALPDCEVGVAYVAQKKP